MVGRGVSGGVGGGSDKNLRKALLCVIMTLHILGGEEFIDYVWEGRGMSAAVIKTNVLVGITPRINRDIIGHILFIYINKNL
jgi:hypothetical protein